MSLINIARDFARQHKIELTRRRNGFIGRRERLALGYWDNGLRQKVLVSKSFPPIDGIYVSKIIIDDDLQPSLKVKILYGCLEDYVVQLDKVKSGDLCRAAQEGLIYSYMDFIENPQRPEEVMQQQFPIDILGHHSDLQDILGSFYPSK